MTFVHCLDTASQHMLNIFSKFKHSLTQTNIIGVVVVESRKYFKTQFCSLVIKNINQTERFNIQVCLLC